MCRNNKPDILSKITSSGNEMLIRFKSGYGIKGRGYKVKVGEGKLTLLLKFSKCGERCRKYAGIHSVCDNYIL